MQILYAIQIHQFYILDQSIFGMVYENKMRSCMHINSNAINRFVWNEMRSTLLNLTWNPTAVAQCCGGEGHHVQGNLHLSLLLL